MLLTDKDYLPTETRSEIVRLTEALWWDEYDVRVWVLGGTAAVSDAVLEEIEGIRHVTHVYRIAGGTRFETAAAVADVMDDEVGTGTTAYLVNGSAWADAIAVAPVAAWDAAPVLMTGKDSVPQPTLDWLADNGVTDVVIVGGEGVVSGAVYDQLDALYSVERVWGQSRYETAKEIALYGVDNLGMNGALATLASGENFVDALSAAPIGWWTGAPLLLTPKTTLHPEVAAYFDEAGGIGEPYGTYGGIGCYVIGGPAAISESVYKAFRDHWMTFLP